MNQAEFKQVAIFRFRGRRWKRRC